MRTDGLLRLLDLARREVGARDARAEVGGEPPQDACAVWCALPDHHRLVVLFDAAPSDADAVRERLEALVIAFEGLADDSRSERETLREPLVRRLDAELTRLSERAGAVGALVIDEHSPVIWGTSLCRKLVPNLDAMADLLAQAKHAEAPDREQLESTFVTARALASVRDLIARRGKAHARLREAVREETFGYVARGFAGIYVIVLAFDRSYSEVVAEGALLHAMPFIERLVLALPPVEPPGGGARIIRLPPQR